MARWFTARWGTSRMPAESKGSLSSQRPIRSSAPSIITCYSGTTAARGFITRCSHETSSSPPSTRCPSENSGRCDEGLERPVPKPLFSSPRTRVWNLQDSAKKTVPGLSFSPPLNSFLVHPKIKTRQKNHLGFGNSCGP
jgi:hypothetical protein